MHARLVALYPELALSDSLGAWIKSRHCFGPHITVLGLEERGGSKLWAIVESQKRDSAITLAATTRAVRATFWQQGVLLADLWTPSLDEVIHSLEAWHTRNCRVLDLQHLIPTAVFHEGSEEYEAGPAAFVAFCWDETLNRLAVDDPELASALAGPSAIQLRTLMPVQTMRGLAFSSCTGHPHIHGPVIGKSETGRYSVSFRDAFTDNLAAPAAVIHAAELLPAGFGPAAHGTAIS